MKKTFTVLYNRWSGEYDLYFCQTYEGSFDLKCTAVQYGYSLLNRDAEPLPINIENFN